MEMVIGQEAHQWDNNNNNNQTILIKELLEGLQAALQLQDHLYNNTSSSSLPQMLVDNIISSSERALSMLHSNPDYTCSTHLMDENNADDRKVASKKRRTMPKWTEQVRVTLETGFDGTVEDGFSWRKYGQKEIQNANHPRSYYKCTNRQQGCLATKHVQRSDEDPLVFDITYRGTHTCHLFQTSQTQPSSSLSHNSLKRTLNHTQQQLPVVRSNTRNSAADMPALPPFPDGSYFAACTQQQADKESNVYQTASFATNSPTGFIDSPDDSFDSDDGSHLSFDISNMFSFD